MEETKETHPKYRKTQIKFDTSNSKGHTESLDVIMKIHVLYTEHARITFNLLNSATFFFLYHDLISA